MIWDLHCHLNGVDGRTPDERIVQLLEYADRMHVDRMILFMGFPFSADPTPAELRRQNDQVLQAISHWHDRCFGFAYVSVRHVEAGLAEIDRCIAHGPLVGIKLWIAGRCAEPQIDSLITRCAELNAVVFQHTWSKITGNEPGESTPEDLVALARRHPEVPLICGHTGGDWERGIRAVRCCPNILVDTAGSDPTAGFVEMAVRELGPERILFGSDAGGRSFASQLAKVQEALIPEAARRLILSGNLRRLLTPILESRGVRF